jgi:hypothetical protein
VIVYRAGIVDESYSQLVHASAPAGFSSQLDAGFVSQFATAVAEAGCKILVYMNGWIIDIMSSAGQQRTATGQA